MQPAQWRFCVRLQRRTFVWAPLTWHSRPLRQDSGQERRRCNQPSALPPDLSVDGTSEKMRPSRDSSRAAIMMPALPPPEAALEAPGSWEQDDLPPGPLKGAAQAGRTPSLTYSLEWRGAAARHVLRLGMAAVDQADIPHALVEGWDLFQL